MIVFVLRNVKFFLLRLLKFRVNEIFVCKQQSRCFRSDFSSSRSLLSFSYMSLYLFAACLLLVSHCPHHSKVEHSSQTLDNSVSLSVPPNPEDCPECTALSIREGAGPGEDLANGEEGDGALEEADREENHLEERIDEEEEEEDDEEEVDGQKKKKKKKKNLFWKCKDLWDEMRLKLWSIVESKYFNRGIMMAILINTISMGIEHHNQVKHITFNL